MTTTPLSHAMDGYIVITGGAGFLGCNLADRLAGLGRRILVVDTLARPHVEENWRWLKERHQGLVELARIDVRDARALEPVVGQATAIFHLAAQVAVTTSIEDPIEDFEINARGTLNLLEAIRRHGGTTPLLFASTNKVYGKLIDSAGVKPDGERYAPVAPELARGADERTPLDFHSPYGCSKGVADQYVIDYARVFGLSTVVFRMSCLYGPRQFGTEDQGWVAHFLISAITGRPITIYGDGYQVRDLLYVDDAVEAWLAAWRNMERVRGRVFNLGGGPANTLSLRELVARIEKLRGTRPELSFGSWRPGDQPWYVSDIESAMAALDWRPGTSVEAGLERLNIWLEARFGATAEVVEELSA